MTTPLPAGFAVTVDPDTRELDRACLFGGSPARAVRLSETGRRAWDELRAGPVRSRSAGLLARRLCDAGLVHPVPVAPTRAADATVVVPVRDRADALERCLASLGAAHPVVVVDDASADPDAVAAVCRRHGALLLRRAVNGGPGPARDTALGVVDTEFVALLDSDCVATPGWVDRLAAHLADPLVAAVAPRVVPEAPPTWAGRYTAANCSLDLGDRPGRVVPGSRVSYVPTAALLVRRSALADVTRDGAVFDADLRVGEDVDLVWRLHEAGWSVRYQPEVQVTHVEPRTWRGLLARRFRYGTSAAPLAARHPTALRPLVLHRWPAVAVLALLGRRPLPALVAWAASVVSLRRTLREKDIPDAGVERTMANAVLQTGLGVSRYATQFAAPLLLAGVVDGVARRRVGRAAVPAALLLASPLAAWWRARPALDLPRYLAGAVAEDVAYGAGVWRGCLTEHDLSAVRPGLVWRTPI